MAPLSKLVRLGLFRVKKEGDKMPASFSGVATYSEYLEDTQNFVFEEDSLYLRVAPNVWIKVRRSGGILVYDGKEYYTTAGNIKKTVTRKYNIEFDRFRSSVIGFAPRPLIPDDDWNLFNPRSNSMFIKGEEWSVGVMFHIRSFTPIDLAELQLRADIDYLLFLGGHSTSAQEAYSVVSLSQMAVPNLGISTTGASASTPSDTDPVWLPIFKKYYEFGLWTADRVKKLYRENLITDTQASKIGVNVRVS